MAIPTWPGSRTRLIRDILAETDWLLTDPGGRQRLYLNIRQKVIFGFTACVLAIGFIGGFSYHYLHAIELKQHVVIKIGAIARPDDIFFTSELPKTRSAKIMRRLLRDIAEGRTLGDTTTLADPAVVSKLRAQYEDSSS